MTSQEKWLTIKLFLKCGITNSLDGSKDNFVFDSSDDESVVADDLVLRKLFDDSN